MNTYLKVKIKSLAEEARIIRREEWRIKSKPVHRRGSAWSERLNGLHHHRTQVVRPEARATQLAYGFLRGRQYSRIEAAASTVPSWDRVAAMVLKYGYGSASSSERQTAMEELLAWMPKGARKGWERMLSLKLKKAS